MAVGPDGAALPAAEVTPYETAYPAGENLFAALTPATVLVAQQAANVAVLLGLWYVCSRLGGRMAATLAVVWWLFWPPVARAVAFPYYYYWPVPATVGLAALWVWRGTGTRWALPLLVLWAQLRMTAVGPILTRGRLGVAALAITLGLVTAGHGRTQVWHDLYIGIGAWPNPYGVEYSDEHAIAVAADYGVAFKSPEYEPTMRREYLKIATYDPLLIASNWITNTTCALFVLSFAWWKYLLWVPLVTAWAAWRDRGVYRALALVWAAQCVTIGFVTRPQEGYLWETMGLYVILGSVGAARALFAAANEWEPF